MIKLLQKNIHFMGIRFIRNFAGNRFRTTKSVGNVRELGKIKKKELAEFQAMKAEVERFRSDFWRKHDKKYYYGAFTFILRKQEEEKELSEEFDYEEEEAKKSRSQNS